MIDGTDHDSREININKTRDRKLKSNREMNRCAIKRNEADRGSISIAEPWNIIRAYRNGE